MALAINAVARHAARRHADPARRREGEPHRTSTSSTPGPGVAARPSASASSSRSSRPTTPTGRGLGLAIARSLVRGRGGDLVLREPRGGAVFRVIAEAARGDR